MFLVLGLPRSRTFWLSKFLSYGDFECGHEETRYLRTVEDAKIWLTQEFRGSAETSVAPFWRYIQHVNPKLKIVVVRRPVADVVKSLLALNLSGVCTFNEKKLTANMKRLDAKLQQIERRAANVLAVDYQELHSLETAEAIFEHCLPYPFDPAWWNSLRNVNLQCNMRNLMRYAIDYRPSLVRSAKIAMHLSRAQIMVKPPKAYDGVTFQQETIDAWERDGVPLLEAHCVNVGESPDNWRNKNVPLIRKMYEMGNLQVTTARCNGRMLGYLMALISPSLETQNTFTGVHTTFFVSPDAPGLGLKLQRASVASLKERGVTEVFFHEGIRGDGPRMGAFYRRLGASEFGKSFRLDLGGIAA